MLSESFKYFKDLHDKEEVEYRSIENNLKCKRIKHCQEMNDIITKIVGKKLTKTQLDVLAYGLMYILWMKNHQSKKSFNAELIARLCGCTKRFVYKVIDCIAQPSGLFFYDDDSKYCVGYKSRTLTPSFNFGLFMKMFRDSKVEVLKKNKFYNAKRVCKVLFSNKSYKGKDFKAIAGYLLQFIQKLQDKGCDIDLDDLEKELFEIFKYNMKGQIKRRGKLSQAKTFAKNLVTFVSKHV